MLSCANNVLITNLKLSRKLYVSLKLQNYNIKERCLQKFTFFEYRARFRCCLSCQMRAMSNIIFGDMYVTTPYLSCQKNVSRGKIWKVRTWQRTLLKIRPADCQKTVPTLGDHHANCDFVSGI